MNYYRISLLRYKKAPGQFDPGAFFKVFFSNVLYAHFL
ncbi:hypothetical protein SPPR111872_16000 [Sphingobacterium prati]